MKNKKTQWSVKFSLLAAKASEAAGSYIVFTLAVTFLFLWTLGALGLGATEVWLNAFNVVTATVTFLLVFLIQNSQNRETRALQLKMDELIRATQGAHNTVLQVEKLTDEELKALYLEYEALAKEARRRLHLGETDVDVPDVALSKRKN